MRTAIIDTGIDIETLSAYVNQPKHFIVYEGNVVASTPPNSITHGGMCARVFAKQAGVLPDVSICLSDDKKNRSNIKDLIIALEWCINNNIELISLSMGTIRFCDAKILEGTVNKLYKAGTILIAASNNNGFITYPAAFDSCIGVCRDYGKFLEANCFAHISNPLDGIDIVTYPVDFRDFNIPPSNSFSAAYVAGIVYNEFKGIASFNIIRNWLLEKSQVIPAQWIKTYFKEKIAHTINHEAIVIDCCGVCFGLADMFLKELQKNIIDEGYSCAIISENIETCHSKYRFSFDVASITLIEVFEIVSRLLRPNVILLASMELQYLADVLVYGDKACQNRSSNALLACEFDNITPNELWIKVRELFK